MCSLHIFIEIIIIVHLNRPVGMLVPSNLLIFWLFSIVWMHYNIQSFLWNNAVIWRSVHERHMQYQYIQERVDLKLIMTSPAISLKSLAPQKIYGNFGQWSLRFCCVLFNTTLWKGGRIWLRFLIAMTCQSRSCGSKLLGKQEK